MEKLYYIKVETHHNNIKGQWIAEEAKAQFNNTVIEADDYPELLGYFQGTVYAGDRNFPRCTFGKIEEYNAPIDKKRYQVHSLLCPQVRGLPGCHSHTSHKTRI